jgi:hypothetical protein
MSSEGDGAKAKLSLALGKSERTLLRWMAEGPPNERETRLLALACGATEAEATAIVREFASLRAQAG